MTRTLPLPQAGAGGDYDGDLAGVMTAVTGRIPQAWLGRWSGGPSAALPWGASLFLVGDTQIDPSGVGGAHGQALSNAALLVSQDRLVVTDPTYPAIPGDSSTVYHPVGACCLPDGTVLACCRGVSAQDGSVVSTRAAVLDVAGEQVTFTRWVDSWPDADGTSVGPDVPVSYHAPVLVPATGTAPDTLVVFGVRRDTEQAGTLWRATVPVADYERGSAWVFDKSPVSTYTEADTTCTAWLDEGTMIVATCRRPGRLDSTVAYRSNDGSTWSRSPWVNVGPSLPGETRGNLQVHPQYRTGDGQVLLCVDRTWNSGNIPVRNARPLWSTSATVSLVVTDAMPMSVSGPAVSSGTDGQVLLTGPGVQPASGGRYLLSSTQPDPTPVTDRVGYTLTWDGAAHQVTVADNPAAGVGLVDGAVSGSHVLSGYTVVTLPGNRVALYAPL